MGAAAALVTLLAAAATTAVKPVDGRVVEVVYGGNDRLVMMTGGGGDARSVQLRPIRRQPPAPHCDYISQAATTTNASFREDAFGPSPTNLRTTYLGASRFFTHNEAGQYVIRDCKTTKDKFGTSVSRHPRTNPCPVVASGRDQFIASQPAELFYAGPGRALLYNQHLGQYHMLHMDADVLGSGAVFRQNIGTLFGGRMPFEGKAQIVYASTAEAEYLVIHKHMDQSVEVFTYDSSVKDAAALDAAMSKVILPEDSESGIPPDWRITTLGEGQVLVYDGRPERSGDYEVWALTSNKDATLAAVASGRIPLLESPSGSPSPSPSPVTNCRLTGKGKICDPKSLNSVPMMLAQAPADVVVACTQLLDCVTGGEIGCDYGACLGRVSYPLSAQHMMMMNSMANCRPTEDSCHTIRCEYFMAHDDDTCDVEDDDQSSYDAVAAKKALVQMMIQKTGYAPAMSHKAQTNTGALEFEVIPAVSSSSSSSSSSSFLQTSQIQNFRSAAEKAANDKIKEDAEESRSVQGTTAQTPTISLVPVARGSLWSGSLCAAQSTGKTCMAEDGCGWCPPTESCRQMFNSTHNCDMARCVLPNVQAIEMQKALLPQVKGAAAHMLDKDDNKMALEMPPSLSDREELPAPNSDPESPQPIFEVEEDAVTRAYNRHNGRRPAQTAAFYVPDELEGQYTSDCMNGAANGTDACLQAHNGLRAPATFRADKLQPALKLRGNDKTVSPRTPRTLSHHMEAYTARPDYMESQGGDASLYRGPSDRNINLLSSTAMEAAPESSHLDGVDDEVAAPAGPSDLRKSPMHFSMPCADSNCDKTPSPPADKSRMVDAMARAVLPGPMKAAGLARSLNSSNTDGVAGIDFQAIDETPGTNPITYDASRRVPEYP